MGTNKQIPLGKNFFSFLFPRIGGTTSGVVFARAIKRGFGSPPQQLVSYLGTQVVCGTSCPDMDAFRARIFAISRSHRHPEEPLWKPEAATTIASIRLIDVKLLLSRAPNRIIIMVKGVKIVFKKPLLDINAESHAQDRVWVVSTYWEEDDVRSTSRCKPCHSPGLEARIGLRVRALFSLYIFFHIDVPELNFCRCELLLNYRLTCELSKISDPRIQNLYILYDGYIQNARRQTFSDGIRMCT